ncbi:potassium channel family protein [Actinomycetospora sp. CA-101289]|uniref:potassium channel family protein n=1 Tax=Actinomycetospora sp. CA-101289 TaxID=3239893 RepID=UPI003D954474
MSPESPSRRRVALSIVRSIATVVVLVVVYYALPLRGEAESGALVLFIGGLVLLGVLIVWQLRAIVRARHPVLRAVEAFASAIPLYLLIFASIYVRLETARPGAFSETLTHTDGLYFTMTVFATVGFGDIAPVTGPARVLVTIQMVGNLLVLGLLGRSVLEAVRRGQTRQGRTPPA